MERTEAKRQAAPVPPIHGAITKATVLWAGWWVEGSQVTSPNTKTRLVGTRIFPYTGVVMIVNVLDLPPSVLAETHVPSSIH